MPLPHASGVHLSGRDELEPLGAQCHLDGTAVEWKHAGRLVVIAPVIRAPGRHRVRADGMREPDQGPAGRSAMRKETVLAPSAIPSSRVTASTASTGEAASALSSIRLTASPRLPVSLTYGA